MIKKLIISLENLTKLKIQLGMYSCTYVYIILCNVQTQLQIATYICTSITVSIHITIARCVHYNLPTYVDSYHFTVYSTIKQVGVCLIVKKTLIICIWWVCMRICIIICYSCNMGTSGLPDMYTRSPRVYISGKPRVHMLQLLCTMAPPTGKH